ncbi:hypothetical protein DOY81_009042 [Sarcophaga bullata]|nr:hypothetical protein DOY81_009042 [Sarcophaga bullata]
MTCTSAEFTANTKNFHRLIYRDMYDLYVTANIASIDGHLSPILHSNDCSKL